jgi:hypothetical protein
MGLLDLIFHLLNFVAPALGVGLLLALLGRVLRHPAPSRSWLRQFAVNAALGCLVLGLGVLLLGRDGKMLTYLALVLVLATGQLVQQGGGRD